MCFLVLIEKIEAPSLHTFNVEATLIDWPLYFKVLGLTLGPRQLLHLFIKWLILPFSCCSVPVSWCMYEPPCRDTGGLGRTAVPGRAPHWHARCRAIELIPAGPVQWKCTGVKQYADKVRTQSAAQQCQSQGRLNQLMRESSRLPHSPTFPPNPYPYPSLSLRVRVIH